ncbi:hypothetical protein I553_2726, partial [Mycobacterium xenopi 4042]
ATVAAIYRCIGNTHPPTLLIDEPTLYLAPASRRAARGFARTRQCRSPARRPRCAAWGRIRYPQVFDLRDGRPGWDRSMPDTITDRPSTSRCAGGPRRARLAIPHSSRRPRLAALRGRLAAWCAPSSTRWPLPTGHAGEDRAPTRGSR